MKYRVKKQYQEQDEMITTINGKTVALVKAFEHRTPATEGGPAKTRTIRLATHDEMAAMYKAGNPVIEEYHETEKAVSEEKK